MIKQELSVTKTKIGRPKSAPTSVVRLPDSVLDAADAWATQQEPQQTRSEAIRQILTDYLKRRGFMK
jgi:metal-responsive CopG/Arc/MetJ family transcriptional regulator